jgi:hypothetical protein
VRYWAEHEDPIIFKGNTYLPLHMFWSSIKTSVGMPTDGDQVALSNLGNVVVRYIKDFDPTSLPVTLQLLHLDLLNTVTRPYERYYKILSMKADINLAMFTLGRQLGKNKLPRRLIHAEEMQ